MVRSRPNVPKNFPPPRIRIRSHLPSMAKRRTCLCPTRPRPHHNQSRQRLPRVFASGVTSPSPSSPVTVIFEDPKAYLTGNHSRHLRYDTTPSHYVPFRHVLEIRGQRHCPDLCLLRIQHERRLVDLHRDVESGPKTVGWGDRNLNFPRLGSIAMPCDS